MNYNGELKEINNEQKAYFLGLMYADGSISINRRKTSTYIRYQVQISLVDEQIIMELLRIFPFFNLQIFDFGKYKKSWSKQFALRKGSKQLFDDLCDHGLLQRKSGENSKFLKMPKLRKDLISHFIRGYFDGDGSINISTKRPNLRRIEICSSSKDYLLQIKSIFINHNINCPIFREKHNNKSPLYVLEWVNSKDVITLKNFFYKDATIFLQRKKEKFDSFKPIDIKDNNPMCPNCLKKKVNKAGKRMMKHGLMYRYSCTNCNHKFSIPAQLKQGELLETPEEDNQQPSENSNILEGSTTNSQIQTDNAEDSNANTSALHKGIIEIKSRGLTIYPDGTVSGGLKPL